MLRLLVLLLLLPAAAGAQERRMLGAEEAAAYLGVGRLNIAGSRFCTATLIAPDVIATAAHCLFHPVTGARVADSELRFVAGYRLRERAALRRVSRTVIDPAYDFETRASYAGVGADIALGRLDSVVPEAVAPMATGALADGHADGPAGDRADGQAGGPALSIVSYGQDRPHAPSIETPCAIVEQTGPVLALDCAVTYGASGSPLFQGEDADRSVVGVVSAMGRLIRPPVDVTFARLLGDLAPLLAKLDESPAEMPVERRPLPRP